MKSKAKSKTASARCLLGQSTCLYTSIGPRACVVVESKNTVREISLSRPCDDDVKNDEDGDRETGWVLVIVDCNAYL